MRFSFEQRHDSKPGGFAWLALFALKSLARKFGSCENGGPYEVKRLTCGGPTFWHSR
jgi:hypothetical protein